MSRLKVGVFQKNVFQFTKDFATCSIHKKADKTYCTFRLSDFTLSTLAKPCCIIGIHYYNFKIVELIICNIIYVLFIHLLLTNLHKGKVIMAPRRDTCRHIGGGRCAWPFITRKLIRMIFRPQSSINTLLYRRLPVSHTFSPRFFSIFFFFARFNWSIRVWEQNAHFPLFLVLCTS